MDVVERLEEQNNGEWENWIEKMLKRFKKATAACRRQTSTDVEGELQARGRLLVIEG